MARNGSGTMLPVTNSWNPQVNGVNATGPDFNQLYFDLLNALTQSLSADGQTPVTGNIQMGNNKLTGLAAGSGTGQSLRWEQLFDQGVEVDVASAATADIGIQNTNFIRITGVTGITSFGTNYRGPRFIRFSGALTLTNSATLVLPGGADITTDAGATAIAYPIGNPSAGWIVAAYRAGNSTVNPPISKIFPISASVATNILTATLSQSSFDFRSSTLSNGTPNTRIVPSTLTLTVPATATLGTTNGVLSRLILVAIDNAGTVELAIINLTNNAILDETGLISTTALTVGSSSANIYYSAVARSNVPYRVIGYIESTQATAGLWASAPSITQGAGGEALVYLGVPAPTTPISVPTRQTVFSGAVDSGGAANFLSAGTGLSINLAATTVPVCIAFAAGFSSSGKVDYVGRIASDVTAAWSGLTANTTNYLFSDRNTGTGVITYVASTLAPIYGYGIAKSIVNGQHTYRIDEGVMYVGNGSVAMAVQRVCIGECVTGPSTVTSVVTYALQGLYDSGWFAIGVGATYSKTHNIGKNFDWLDVDGWVSTVTNGAARRKINNATDYGSGVTAGGDVIAVDALLSVGIKISSSTVHPNGVPLTNTGYPEGNAQYTTGFVRLFVKRGW